MSILPWVGFVAFVLIMLAIDLGVLNRRAHVIGTREALGWTAFWITLALLFNILVYFMYEHHWCGIGAGPFQEPNGRQAALKFFTGYLIEKSLSLDNIFVIAMIFIFFGVPRMYQHRVLFWGILGALIMRGLMIAAGVVLIRRFDWVIYVFGGLLLLTAAKMLYAGKEEKVEPGRNVLVRIARYFYPVTDHFEEQKFFTRLNGRRAITPLLLALLVVESTDVLFAIDSIPAIFAITKDPFIVFTSNIFAILGLRSLFFALAGMLDKFRYLKVCLAFILGYVGIKMILAHHFEINALVSLAVISAILAAGIAASLLHPDKKGRESLADIGREQ